MTAPAKIPIPNDTAQTITIIIVGNILITGTRNKGRKRVSKSNSVKHSKTYKRVNGSVIMPNNIKPKQNKISSKDFDWNKEPKPIHFEYKVSLICQDNISLALVL